MFEMNEVELQEYETKKNAVKTFCDMYRKRC